MTELLTQAIFPLTIILMLLLISHRRVLQYFGAKVTYLTWALVPLALIFYTLLPTMLFTSLDVVAPTGVEQFIVSSSQTIEQMATFNWLMLFSAAMSMIFIVIGVSNHLYFHHTMAVYRYDKLTTEPEFSIDNVALPSKLALYLSDNVDSPMISGIFKPKLIIPSNFCRLYDREQQELILAHEICHFDRNDIYWNLVAYCFISLFWFHPLVWLAYFRFRRDQELACDQTVLAHKQFESRVNYTRALLVTAQHKPRLAIAHLSFNEYGDKEIMLERITQIKVNKKPSKKHALALALCGIVLMSGVSYAGYVGQQGKEIKASEKSTAYPVVRIEPKYPVAAAKEGIEGAVLLKFDIDANGHTKNIRVVAASPEAVFDKVSIAALSQWKYGSDTTPKSEDLIIQLDFVLSDTSNKPVSLVERIKVSK